MTQDILSEFANGWACDNSMAALSIRACEPVESAQLIELCSGAKTLFSLATLACRSLDRVRDCHRLWTDVLATFERAQNAWTDTPTDNDSVLCFYVGQLSRLVILSRDRLDIYWISPSERETYVRRHKNDFTEDRTAQRNVDLNVSVLRTPSGR